MTCELHEPTEKICNYCFSCDKLEFDGRIWVPEEQLQQAQAERDALVRLLLKLRSEAFSESDRMTWALPLIGEIDEATRKEIEDEKKN